MSYVSPRLAPLVAPPAGIIAERRPNGGLFMAATTDTFRTADPGTSPPPERSRRRCNP